MPFLDFFFLGFFLPLFEYAHLFFTEKAFLESDIFKKSVLDLVYLSRESVLLSKYSDFQPKILVGYSFFGFPVLTKTYNKCTSK